MGRRTIQDFVATCKRGLWHVVGVYGIAGLVVLVGLASFGLGRLSTIEDVRPVVSVGNAPAAQTAARAVPLGGQFVASQSGSVYYYPWCGGAQNIKPENQRWFNTEKAAQAAGLRPAKNCKGLSVTPSAVE